VISQIPQTEETVLTDLSDGVLTITLNRPDKRNALTHQMIDAVSMLIRWAGHESSVRCLLIAGRGKAFCAGDDLNGLGPLLGIEQNESTEMDAYQSVVLALLRLRKPSVAAVNGPAHGGGMEFALACDLRIGATGANFGPATTSLGGSAFTTLLPLYVGVAQARKILYLSKPIDSTSALSLGLLDEVVSEDEVAGAARALAVELAAGPTRAYGLIKHALLLGAAPHAFASLLIEEEYTRSALTTADAREGLVAYAEKRPPNFIGE